MDADPSTPPGLTAPLESPTAAAELKIVLFAVDVHEYLYGSETPAAEGPVTECLGSVQATSLSRRPPIVA